MATPVSQSRVEIAGGQATAGAGAPCRAGPEGASASRGIHSAPPSLSLVINTFDQPEYLRRVLRAVSAQTAPPAEVIFADDGSGGETRTAIERWGREQGFPISHAWQPQAGFRRSRILNLAVALARAEYLVFLDGDTLPHPRFLEDHRRLARAGFFVQGHRSLVQQQGAAWFGLGPLPADRRRALLGGQLRGLKHAFRWPRPWRRLPAGIAGIRGCNLAVWRRDLEKVNGYNEAFVGWGREDSELAARLENAGIRRLDVRGWAICYHLWHPPASRARLPINDQLLAAALALKASWCETGLTVHLTPPRPAIAGDLVSPG